MQLRLRSPFVRGVSMMPIRHVILALAIAAFSGTAVASPLAVKFDFSKHVIGFDVTVKGAPLFALLDTGVEPSIVDLARADALRLPVERAQGGEGSGFGSRKAEAFPATIRGLAIDGQAFGDIEALALDNSALSKGYGRAVDVVLGYSFLKSRAVLIDYAATTLTLLSGATQAQGLTRSCAKHYTIPLVFLGDNHWPVISQFHIGSVAADVTLDTGSSRFIGFFQRAVTVKGIRDALKVTGTNFGASVGGEFTSRTATLGVPVGLGPFGLPAGESVSLLPNNGQSDSVLANLGNPIFAAMTPKLLLDYAGGRISFYGACRR